MKTKASSGLRLLGLACLLAVFAGWLACSGRETRRVRYCGVRSLIPMLNFSTPICIAPPLSTSTRPFSV